MDDHRTIDSSKKKAWTTLKKKSPGSQSCPMQPGKCRTGKRLSRSSVFSVKQTRIGWASYGMRERVCGDTRDGFVHVGQARGGDTEYLQRGGLIWYATISSTVSISICICIF
ncbi:unnamed protein product [Fusarium graminearum]|uniref:Chromosome 1, complete genome n=1 Tax=Gibberella zeae (strain ATCC MYA-4620 / CBS 123657 / FGSC 9075 / NRRL 31084 / PH-1) TaxID=229533 RepID=I1R9N0_GIBZE|nr:hypothetical protein FGSG_00181 [Fusarium graminearum PH-1]ESU05312.1 hypothetical protein FGSG_00181 [Fusarium graminearum PH-1]EYB34210.1 hypothetical protein FG05_00181 [Fusarium graminearum]CEF72049.1 unnamed protein product [Fusarium graminearum]CZS75311.1 unnamed protein product [Fusarium graminearum]|eukprot:XP_011315797.1 hypothetical protein FGSG_00181 [Fusarium graminearum PH-1]